MTPTKQHSRIEELEQVCAELYEVIGSLAYRADCFNHPGVQRALDNASKTQLVHRDLLPFSIEDSIPMTPTEQQIVAQLECKRQLEINYEGPIDEPTAWLIEAIALLLRHQLELVEELRNAGILR